MNERRHHLWAVFKTLMALSAMSGCTTAQMDGPEDVEEDAAADIVALYDTSTWDSEVSDADATDAHDDLDASGTEDATISDTCTDTRDSDTAAFDADIHENVDTNSGDVLTDIEVSDAGLDADLDTDRDVDSDALDSPDSDVGSDVPIDGDDVSEDAVTDADAAPDATPDPCADVVCDAPPSPRCDGATPVTYGAGVCSSAEGAATCNYPATHDAACDESSTLCLEGTCQPGYVDIDVGGGFRSAHACAVRFDTTVWCWGNNVAGQLGGATPDDTSEAAVAVSVDAAIHAVACGANHTCALDADARVWCWGANAIGQLGDDGESRATPAIVAGIDAPVVAIAAGGNSSWALTEGGQLLQWGGIPPYDVDRSPTPRVWATDVVRVEGARRGAVFQYADGSAGYVGALGTGLASSESTEALPFASGADIALGWEHGCLVDEDGAVACFGRDGGLAGDGDSATAFHATPSRVVDIAGALGVAVSSATACAIVGDEREVFCWGTDESGSIGRGNVDAGPHLPRVTYGFLRRVVELEAGWSSFVVRTSDGRVWAWGLGESHVLGDRAGLPDNTPNPLALPLP